MKKSLNVILAIIIVVQLIVPVTMLSVYTVRRNEFEANGKEFKIKLDSVSDGGNSFVIDSMDVIVFGDYMGFEETENGFFEGYEIYGKPDTDYYIDSYGLDVEYRKEGNLKDFDSAFSLYNEENEYQNIENGRCQGPETEAYMILKVYKGICEIKEINIAGYDINEYCQKVENGEFDASRYEYYYDFDFDYEDDDYEEIYDEELDEYVTVPVSSSEM